MLSSLLRPLWAVLALVSLLAGCAVAPPGEPVPSSPAEVRERIASLLPANLPDRTGWAIDIHAAFVALDIPPSLSNVCAVLAVTEQESSYRADPAVPNLPKIARAELDQRAARLHLPKFALRAALQLASPDGRTYGERIDAARTEKELSDIFEDFIDMVPLGQRLFGGFNPVRTGGAMQVSIAFAEQHASERRYPYRVAGSIRNEVFARRGGLYFGIAHLLDYAAPYDRHLYRFADFNAGRYASRNAAFQSAVSIASGTPLALDGDLLRQGSDRNAAPGSTELAVRSLGRQLGMDDAAIRAALEQGEGPGFERSVLHRRVFELAKARHGRPLPHAVLPRIALRGPKITRKLTTEWFANRVDERHRRCLARAGAAP
jgi:hypothetical protein